MKRFLFMVFLTNFCFQPAPAQMETDSAKRLVVKEIRAETGLSLDSISSLLEQETELHTIGVVNWNAFPYQPKVQFRIAHSNNQIWLKYYVEEEHILAKRTDIHGSVSRDSCVEFFFDPLGDGNYYNFEFNCIGTPHLAYGPDRRQREFVDPYLVGKHLSIASSLGNQPFEERGGGHQWEMVMVLPAALMTEHPGIELKGLAGRANFYKCGDDTALKHYVTWNPVGTPKPDYHQPTFFGEVVFE